MNQIIEGIDNEVTLVLFFFTTVIALIIPLYVLRPSRSNTQRNRQPVVETRTSQEENNENSVEHSNNISSNPNGEFNHATNEFNSSPLQGDFNQQSSSSSTIKIKIKHNETTQEQIVSSSMFLKDLKQKCYPSEVAAGKTIRMIFSGRILAGENDTLHNLGISDGCVIHSVISDPVANGNTPNANARHGVEHDLDFSGSFVFIYSFLVVGFWMLIFMYTEWFSTSSIAIMGFLTILGFIMQFCG